MTATEGASGDSPKAHYGKVDVDPRMSADEMDERRKQNLAYEYLCHLEEAKIWIEACINEKLPPTTELEEGLRNGVYLAKLGHFMSPEVLPLRKIYDRDQARFKARGLHFRHTDNTVQWLRTLEDIGFPKIFYPETTDVYDRKNMPRVMYCIHALSLYLFKLGRAPQIEDLYGKIKFTDEEISAMRQELEKYGIQMPAFSKIGGILANEMPVDEAALHAAVIAINEAIDHQVASETMVALQNPAAHLNNIHDDLSDRYQEVLFEAKLTKAEIARNKSLDPDSSYIPDVYDELLTQAELQGNINKVNTLHALELVNEALSSGDAKELLKVLQMPHLGLREVKDENAEFYLGRVTEARDFKKNNNSDEWTLLNRDEIQMAVSAANLDADSDYQKMLAVNAVNEALDSGDAEATLTALQNPAAQLPPVADFAGQLYYEELQNMRLEKEAALNHDDLLAGVKVLTAVARINEGVDTGNSSMTTEALKSEDALITGFDSSCQEKYHKQLAAAKTAKRKSPCDLLTHFEVQQSVTDVNQQVHDENLRIEAIGIINITVDKGAPQKTLDALKMPTARLEDVDDRQKVHYQNQLTRLKKLKMEEENDPTAVLWCEEIQRTIQLANQQADEGTEMSVGIVAVNLAVDTDGSSPLLSCLQNPDVGFHSVTEECADIYHAKLAELKEVKADSGERGSGWMMNRLQEGHKFYFNVNSLEYAWERLDGVKKDHSILTREEIQACVTGVTAAYDRELLFKTNESFIIATQAYIRGYLARKKYKERLAFLQTQLPAITTLQAWWRMQRQRNQFRNRLSLLHGNEGKVTKLQSYVRMYIQRKKYLERKNFFQENEETVVKIQAFMRSNWAKQDYQALMHGENPPVSVVRKFVHLLDLGDVDYTEEIELQKLRQAVVSAIRSNQKLEDDLNQMDIKIGLLVKNRITLQDVISQHRTLKQYRENSSGALNKGLKGLSKASRERLEAYQNLFYLLQTNPVYLARLIFEMPQSRSTQFMESVILTLYNYASNQREEFLLLKLFKTALMEEIRSKVDKMGDITTGNPMVLKMIISFNRNTRGQGSLRELLNPLIKEVVEDKNLSINTNPVDVYKQWINQKEMDTGVPSGLPYEVTPEQALTHPEVQQRIKQSIENLRTATEKFFNAILTSLNKIPYGMRYMAKVMKASLHDRFPEAPEKDVLKVVGNLIYYRFINSSIVAPDAFDIIDVTASKGLTNDQRRNLGSIAKILQFAASNKGFGGDSAHLSSLNPYIMEAHVRFKKYFSQVCEVEEPEATFNIDQYTDVTRVTKPMIYISISEIIDTHKLLLEHQDAIAEDHNDPLHELLEDLRDVPEPSDLIGDGTDEKTTNQAKLASTEISLTLSNKFEVPDDDVDMKSLLVRTKRMVVDVIRCQRRGDNLVQILSIPATDDEELDHRALVMWQCQMNEKAVRNCKAKLLLPVLQLSYGQPWGNNSPLLLRIATGGTGKDSPLQRIRNESGHSRLSKSPSNGSDYSPRNSAGGKYLPLSRTSSTDSLNSGGPDQIVHPSLSPKKQQQLQHQQELVQRQLQAQQQQQQQHRVPSPDQEDEHGALIKRRDRVDQRAVNKTAKLVRQQSMVGDTRLPLEKMKLKIQTNLDQLEKGGLTSRKDNYQSIINSVVQDIRNQRLYRQRRKQEMMRIKTTQKSLETKKLFYSEQIEYYNKYVKTCLDNLSTKGKKSGWRVSLFSKESGPKAKGSIKYSAAKLYEKGVILEIEGLPTNQFKNVLFEISATELPGMFDVNAKFMGVSMEKVELVFQDLLQLQYEGVAVMKMFDKARINVNLLIFLLNKKFYGK